jgi:hypothetical protein
LATASLLERIESRCDCLPSAATNTTNLLLRRCLFGTLNVLNGTSTLLGYVDCSFASTPSRLTFSAKLVQEHPFFFLFTSLPLHALLPSSFGVPTSHNNLTLNAFYQ